MEGGDQDRGAVRMDPAPQLADRLPRAQQSLGGHAAERQDHLGLDDAELLGQERRARSQLVTLGIPVAGRATLDRVADVDLLARELYRFQHLREELTGPTHERQPLRVLVGAGPLADDDEVGLRVAGAEHDRLAALAELALAAPLQPRLLRAQRLARRRQEVAAERHRLDAEVPVKPEDRGEIAEGVGQRGPRIVAQRTAFGAGCAVRRARISSRMASATAAFRMRGSGRLPPQRSMSSTSLSSESKPMSRRLTSLTTSRSMPLASSLARALATTS